ncbi:hypothetical protein [Pararhizobium sp. LjRoot238]|uniref:hypothetical protein n=1 Tax=Pararhizobium sp. LjRoot238 TaxID=3342293 RepID=UPI003ECC3AD1
MTVMKKREPLFRIGDFAIWSAILASVVGYQLWAQTNTPALTTVIAITDKVTG